MTPSDDTATSWSAGRVKEVAGLVTGDRRVEAKGRAEQEEGVDADDDQSVAEVEEDVRADHGEVPPDGPVRR